MDNNRPLNMIIAGIGGQGVNTLTQVFRQLSDLNDIYCTGSVYKGGAQRMGTVHSEMRLFAAGDGNCDMYSTEIPPGDLDLLVGLEPWEALRYQEFIGPGTTLIVNSFHEPFFLERTGDFDAGDPLILINALNIRTTINNYTEEALRMFGSARMANYLMGLESIQTRLLPFSADEYNEAFSNRVNLSRPIVRTMGNPA